MFMKSFYTLLVLALFTLSFSGCHLFESTQVPTTEIEAASAWSQKDLAPTFPICEDIEVASERQECFESVISNSISEYIIQNPWESKVFFEEQINVKLLIDKEGNFTLKEVLRSDAIDAAIPNLVEQLEQAVSQLPQAKPAVKTNVGTYVSTELTLPIMIFAE